MTISNSSDETVIISTSPPALKIKPLKSYETGNVKPLHQWYDYEYHSFNDGTT